MAHRELSLVLCDNLEEWDGGGVGEGRRFKRKGTYVYVRLIHVVVWQKPTEHCKSIIHELKFLKNYG